MREALWSAATWRRFSVRPYIVKSDLDESRISRITPMNPGSARGSRAGLKAWPLLRNRCSGGLAETQCSTLQCSDFHAREEAVGIFRWPANIGCPITAKSWAAIYCPLSTASTLIGKSSGRSPLHQAAAYPLHPLYPLHCSHGNQPQPQPP